MASGNPPAGSYNVSEALSALGIRDARVIPSLRDPGTITPTISFGEFETFVGEVIEARGIINFNIAGQPAGLWAGVKMLSVAPGGTLLEALVMQPDGGLAPFWFASSAPLDPWAGGFSLSPWTIGGQQLVNVFNQISGQVGAPPTGDAFGGSFTGPAWPSVASAAGDTFARIWIPAGWWFWVDIGTFGVASPNHRLLLRWREIPQAQGAA